MEYGLHCSRLIGGFFSIFFLVQRRRERSPSGVDEAEKWGKSMDLRALKDFVENAGEDLVRKANLDDLPEKFYDAFITSGVRIDSIEPGRVICSMKVPPRLVVGSVTTMIPSSLCCFTKLSSIIPSRTRLTSCTAGPSCLWWTCWDLRQY